MAAPFPYDAKPGASALQHQVARLFIAYRTMAQDGETLNTAVDTDLAVLMRFGAQLKAYRDIFDRFASAGDRAVFRQAIASVFGENGVQWATGAAMVTDLQALYDGAGVMLSAIETAFPAPRIYKQTFYDAQWKDTDQPIVVAKVLAAEFAVFRALYA